MMFRFRLALLCAAAGLTIAFPAVAEDPPQPKKVAIVIFDGVQIIDYSGPYEAFADAGTQIGAGSIPLAANGRFRERILMQWNAAFGREEPDGRLQSGHLTGIGGLHSLAFLAAQGALLNASPDDRRGRPLTASSQKSSAGIGHSRVLDGLFER